MGILRGGAPGIVLGKVIFRMWFGNRWGTARGRAR